MITLKYSAFRTFFIRNRSSCIQTCLFILLCIASGQGSALAESLPSWLGFVLGDGQNSSPEYLISGAAIAAVAAAAISAGGAAYGANQNKKAGDANARNQQAYNKATQLKEKEARKLYDDFVKQWEEKKEELGDEFTLAQFVQDTLDAAGDPRLQDLYYSVRQRDWETAQSMADEAMVQNESAFNRLVNNVSGGDYQSLVQARNQAVLGSDAQSIYNRARELQAPNIAAGSVRQGGDTTFQRADRQEYQVAQEAVMQADEIRFNRARAAIEDDRVAAQRQQERALSFLPAVDYLGYAQSSVIAPSQSARLQLGMSELNFYANMAAQSMGAAFASPAPPPAIATNPGDALMRAGIEGVGSALGGLYNTQGASTQSTQAAVPANNVSSVPSSTSSDTTGIFGSYSGSK